MKTIVATAATPMTADRSRDWEGICASDDAGASGESGHIHPAHGCVNCELQHYSDDQRITTAPIFHFSAEEMATTVSPPANAGEPGNVQSLIRRSRERVPKPVWYGLAALGVALLVILAQIIMYQQRREPRDARAIVLRELRMNALESGEPVIRSVAVFRRNAVDYFRATRGLLVLTDRRLIYLGAPPRDVTGSADAPPTFDQRVFPIDTLVSIEPSFAVLGMSRALTIESPDGDLEVGIATGGRDASRMLRNAWEARHKRLLALGVWAGKVRNARAELGQMLAEYRKQPVYHEVQPGDALSSIASWYEIPADQIRQLNGLSGNTIKVGQRLLIRRGAANGASR